MSTPKFSLFPYTNLEWSRGILYPVSRPVEVIQARDRDASGQLHVEDLGVVVRRMVLRFAGLPSSDYAAAKTWFEDVARGALRTFVYTDPDGVNFQVRWVSSVYDFVETSDGMFAGTVELEEVDS